MKLLPPSQVIAEYEAAHRANNMGADPWWDIEYVGGWFCFVQDDPDHGPQVFKRYRGAQIIHMTATLNERAKAKG